MKRRKKLSETQKIYKKIRKLWAFMPTNRVVESKKIYNRKKKIDGAE